MRMKTLRYILFIAPLLTFICCTSNSNNKGRTQANIASQTKNEVNVSQASEEVGVNVEEEIKERQNWQYSTAEDPMTGNKIVMCDLWSLNTTRYHGETFFVDFSVSYRDSEVTIGFSSMNTKILDLTNEDDGSLYRFDKSAQATLLKFDDDEAVLVNSRVTKDGSGFVLLLSNQSDAFLRRLANSKKLVVRTRSANSDMFDFTFNTSGFIYEYD